MMRLLAPVVMSFVIACNSPQVGDSQPQQHTPALERSSTEVTPVWAENPIVKKVLRRLDVVNTGYVEYFGASKGQIGPKIGYEVSFKLDTSTVGYLPLTLTVYSQPNTEKGLLAAKEIERMSEKQFQESLNRLCSLLKTLENSSGEESQLWTYLIEKEKESAWRWSISSGLFVSTSSNWDLSIRSVLTSNHSPDWSGLVACYTLEERALFERRFGKFSDSLFEHRGAVVRARIRQKEWCDKLTDGKKIGPDVMNSIHREIAIAETVVFIAYLELFSSTVRTITGLLERE